MNPILSRATLRHITWLFTRAILIPLIHRSNVVSEGGVNLRRDAISVALPDDGTNYRIMRSVSKSASTVKDAAGHTEAEKKKQCLWKLDEISENSCGCVEAIRAKRSNYRFHSRYTFSEGASPPGIKSRNLFLMVTTSFLDSVFLSRNSRHIRHRFQVKSNEACASFISELIARFLYVHICLNIDYI